MLQENNTIVVTSGQVLVDGQAVKLRVDNEHYHKFVALLLHRLDSKNELCDPL